MKNLTLTLTLALATLVFTSSTQAAAYLKFDGIDGEAQATPSRSTSAQPQAEPIQGALDRDIIRRHSDTTGPAKGKKIETEPKTTPTTRLPTTTQLRGVEPDEID